MNYKALVPVVMTLMYGCATSPDTIKQGIMDAETPCQTLRLLEEHLSLDSLVDANPEFVDEVFQAAFDLYKDSLGKRSCGLKRSYEVDDITIRDVDFRVLRACSKENCDFVMQEIPRSAKFGYKPQIIKGQYQLHR